MAQAAVIEKSGHPAASVIVPLALAQFICSFAATNMNVAISSIAQDLSTTVLGVQTAITLFTLVMAALMIPGSKLTDSPIYGEGSSVLSWGLVFTVLAHCWQQLRRG